MKNVFIKLILLYFMGYTAMSDAETKDYTLPENCNVNIHFKGVNVPNVCSPVINDDETFIGIVINGPGEIIWPETEKPQEASPFGSTKGPVRLLIAAEFIFPASYRDPKRRVKNEILFVAVNLATKDVYSGRQPAFGKQRKRKKSDIGDYDPTKDSDKRAEGSINPDLVNICGLPNKNATYIIYATLENFKSNVLMISTVSKEVDLEH